jgi:hypothetical protein
MRIRTANTLRAIDSWSERFRSRNSSFLGGLLVLVLGFASSKRYLLAFPPLILYLALNFAFLQLGALILIGFFLAKLYSYRFANAVIFKPFRF